MNLFITGGAGFIGSNFVQYILNQHKDIQIVNLDKLTYAGNIENLQEVMKHPRHTFVQGDICDASLINYLFERYQIDGVIHFAAESHVDNSINHPLSFVQTNVLGTMTLLEEARRFWMDGIGKHIAKFQNATFLHVSTDEVYGSLGAEGFFTEQSAYAPNSPYSASKASSDFIVRSYFHTYNMNVITTNCSNNYGPNQHIEKLIPTIIRKALSLEKIPIYGDGKNVRDWLYVLDHCRAIERIFFEGESGESYLIGGHNERSNIEIAQVICEILNVKQPLQYNDKEVTSYKQLIEFVEDRPGHDYRYAIDDTKLQEEIGFCPIIDFEKGLELTINHYLKKYREKKLTQNTCH
jgi:dTDP-glucose 4,6-dehydratase